MPFDFKVRNSLLDDPSPAVEVHHPGGVGGGVHRVRGEQPPVDGRLSSGRIDLAGFDHLDRDLLRIPGIGALLGLAQDDRTEAQRQDDGPRRPPGPRLQLEVGPPRLGPGVDLRMQPPAFAAQRPIVMAAHQQMSQGAIGVQLGKAGEDLVDVAFTVVKHGDQGRIGQGRPRPPGRFDPAIALLGLDGLRLVVGRLGLGAPPDGRPGQPQDHGRACRLHRQGGMDEQAHVAAIAHPPKVAFAPRLGLVVDLAGVGDQQDMATGRRLGGARRRCLQDLLRRHLGITEEPRRGDHFGPAVTELAHRRREARAEALQDKRPLL
jgi:hypothetical protein